MRDEDELGGDAACWSGLFNRDLLEDAPLGTPVIDLGAIAESFPGRGPAWTLQSEDLNVNLLRFRHGEGVDEHVNTEVDVLIVGIAGDGAVIVDGLSRELQPGQALLIRKGSRRGTRATGDSFAYLTCHRRRAGLMPR
jgi:mannose-6-phosphate isomerase-like protein (cupin superfamily)